MSQRRICNAIYAGTFDPWTHGHTDIVEQALDLFDRVYVLFAINPTKQRKYNMHEMMAAAKNMFLHHDYEDRIIFIESKQFTVDAAHNFSLVHDDRIDYLVRGIRNVNDFMQEEILAEANRKLWSSMETVYIRSRFPVISSTMANEVFTHRDHSFMANYVTHEVLEVMIKWSSMSNSSSSRS